MTSIQEIDMYGADNLGLDRDEQPFIYSGWAYIGVNYVAHYFKEQDMEHEPKAVCGTRFKEFHYPYEPVGIEDVHFNGRCLKCQKAYNREYEC